MPRALSRLRWQLTGSHLGAIAFTLVSMIVALVLISSAWLARTSEPISLPADDARVVASAVQGLVLAELREPTGGSTAGEPTGGSTAGQVDLSGVLRMVASGDLRVLSGPPG